MAMIEIDEDRLRRINEVAVHALAFTRFDPNSHDGGEAWMVMDSACNSLKDHDLLRPKSYASSWRDGFFGDDPKEKQHESDTELEAIMDAPIWGEKTQ